MLYSVSGFKIHTVWTLNQRGFDNSRFVISIEREERSVIGFHEYWIRFFDSGWKFCEIISGLRPVSTNGIAHFAKCSIFWTTAAINSFDDQNRRWEGASFFPRVHFTMLDLTGRHSREFINVHFLFNYPCAARIAKAFLRSPELSSVSSTSLKLSGLKPRGQKPRVWRSNVLFVPIIDSARRFD